MIEAGGKLRLEITGEDLVKFADRLIEKTQEMKEHERALRLSEQTWLSPKQVAEKFNVSPSTLWLWAKAGYLVPRKVGKRNRYAVEDIEKMLTDTGGVDPIHNMY